VYISEFAQTVTERRGQSCATSCTYQNRKKCPYKRVSGNYVLHLLAEVGSLNSEQDGAGVHFDATGSTALDERFPGRWIGKTGPIHWPSLSPDVTSMGFFWEHIKDVAYRRRAVSLPGLRRRIRAAVAAVPVVMFSRVWGEMEFRFDVCRAVSGAHSELH
jgi:hypothetical protein